MGQPCDLAPWAEALASIGILAQLLRRGERQKRKHGFLIEKTLFIIRPAVRCAIVLWYNAGP
jgi:hypothetical protein